MWTLAIKTLVADRGKLLTALVGVVFAVVQQFPACAGLGGFVGR